MSYHEGSNWQAKKEDEGKPLYKDEPLRDTMSAGTWVPITKESVPPIEDANDYPKPYIMRCKGDDPRTGWVDIFFTSAEHMLQNAQNYDYCEYLDESSASSAGDGWKQHAIEFVDWLAEMTEVIYEEQITLYRYYNSENKWGNYILEDIYLEFLEHLKRK